MWPLKLSILICDRGGKKFKNSDSASEASYRKKTSDSFVLPGRHFLTEMRTFSIENLRKHRVSCRQDFMGDSLPRMLCRKTLHALLTLYRKLCCAGRLRSLSDRLVSSWSSHVGGPPT